MRNRFKGHSSRIRFHIGDVRDPDSIRKVMTGADYVFHAAALKQVPSCEFFPIEAVKTNVFGSSNVIREAIQAEVRSVVCLSTDKAVAPINAMGMSKALMEKVTMAEARAYQGARTTVSAVRYGNVLFSRGSAVPLFLRQALEGVDLTITDPRMTRFMMTLESAVSLVEYAFTNANPGDLFIHKAPAASVVDIANTIISMVKSGSQLTEIGIRHGEKLDEVLASEAELRRAQDLGDVFRIPMDDRDLNYSKYFAEGYIDDRGICDFTSANAHRMTTEEIRAMLMQVPEIAMEVEMKARMG